MDPVSVLERLGGIAHHRDVRAQTSRSQLGSAVRSGEVVRLPRNLLALPGADRARVCARAAGGVVSHLCAAQHWQWKVKQAPRIPHVTVPRGRQMDRSAEPLRGDDVRIHWATLPPADVIDGVTSPLRTVMECARFLPFDEALAVADSALRSGLVASADLVAAAWAGSRTGRGRALRVARAASARAANPFESVLRAIALDVDGLDVCPQVWVGRIGRADLVDARLLIAVEADSWEFHGSPETFRLDVRRYADFARTGYVVVRFDWDRVRHRPDEVRRTLLDVVRIRERQLYANHCSSCPISSA